MPNYLRRCLRCGRRHYGSCAMTPEQYCAYLNSILDADREAVSALLKTGRTCNGALADHPTVPVWAPGTREPDAPVVTALGILCGAFGYDAEKNTTNIVAIADDDLILRFEYRP